MSWLALSAAYGAFLLGALWLWNRKLHGLLGLFVLATCLIFTVSPFFGIPWACALGFVFGILLSLLGWWYSAQTVKPKDSQILLVGRLSVSLIFVLQVLLSVLPVGIWADWRVSLALLTLNSVAWMKAGAVSTDAYVLNRAQEITQGDPQLNTRAAMAKAEAEMRANVDDMSDPDPAVRLRRDLVEIAGVNTLTLWTELRLIGPSQLGPSELRARMGSAAYVLYCFDLRLGQFFSEDFARSFVSDAAPSFARTLDMSVKQFSEMYAKYAPAFYAVDVWFQKGGPCDRDESFRSMAAAEKTWEVIAGGPDADTSRRSNPNPTAEEPGGSLSLLRLLNVAVTIGESCKNLADNQNTTASTKPLRSDRQENE